MAWTYDSSLGTDRDRLRFLTGDTISTDQQFEDAELEYLLETHGVLYTAAAAACRALATRFARYADKWVGDLKILASQKSRNYAALADAYDMKAAMGATYAVPTAPAMYADSKSEYAADESLVQGTFYRGMHDNPE